MVGGRFEEDGGDTFDLISGDLLNKIPEGEFMDVSQSTNWEKLKDNWLTIRYLHHPDNLNAILAISALIRSADMPSLLVGRWGGGTQQETS